MPNKQFDPEELPPLPLDDPLDETPLEEAEPAGEEHVPPDWQLPPMVVQSWQPAFPVPHAVSVVPATHVPVESQHPVHEAPQAPPAPVEAPPSSPPAPPLAELVAPPDALE
jgi:hypothetical protein